jgi:type II secretory ATPase GspE/PulE/Tfp pilus assembly ATPase PilB-like protein
MERADHAAIERVATRSGYRSMRYDGLRKVLLGLTTLSEVLRATPPADGVSR